jgi:hypothetical protein
MDDSKLAIINIRMTNVNPLSDPATLVHKYLEVYFSEKPERLYYHLQDFEITPEDPESMHSHRTRLDEAVAMLERCAGVFLCQLLALTESMERDTSVS